MTRQRKTPQQRAQERLDVATRAVDRIAAKIAEHESELTKLRAEHAEHVRRRDHFAGDPDLQPPAEDDPLPELDDDA